MTALGTRLHWTADRDGIGHARHRERGYWTLCGRRATGEQFAWPIQTKCGVCRAFEQEVEARDKQH